MVRKILIFPDPLLRKVSHPVHPDKHDPDELWLLLQDMEDTMKNAGGEAISAIQIGEPYRVLVTRSGNVMINPTIMSQGLETGFIPEGCLSFPSVFAHVKRFALTRVQYWDRDMCFHEEDLRGLDAQVVQHEIEHMDGKLLFDHLPRHIKDKVMMQYKQLRRKVGDLNDYFYPVKESTNEAGPKDGSNGP